MERFIYLFPEEEVKKKVNYFVNLSLFPQVVSAIDGYHIRIKPP